MHIVAALGGNALLRRGEHPDAAVQQQHVHDAARSLAELVLAGHEVVITHGNGPQVGLLAAESEADPALAAPYPLDVVGAETQGMIGTLLARELGSRLPGRAVAALITHTEVDPHDPALGRPDKFVGGHLTDRQARLMEAERGWTTARDGDRLRRTVPSPRPVAITEMPAIRALLATGTVVIAAGGGGIPVVRDPDTGRVRGVEAVVDKDLTAALLAELLDADALLILTDVTHVFTRFGAAHPGPITDVTPDGLRELDLPAGSMRPKAEAAAAFAETAGRVAVIGPLDDALGALLGTTGTTVRPRLPGPAAPGPAARPPAPRTAV
ncbi:carbamate kinase [Kitasatospora sp. DSM 101779]|uniref:carbamate kinase n=1 Tax=Kitasatospora sp. DSM 101779 TaxID=2853165 RepID=UPI0021D902A9|nr:carbamate kinase [Kitasatospora sp. DSM 101779]MCU7826450.1 carbamate kinase [Kitasatospora sp. DSM 101779]